MPPPPTASMAGRSFLLVVVALIAAATPAEGIKLVYQSGNSSVEEYFTHLRVESSIELPLEELMIVAELFVPCDQIAVGLCAPGFTDIPYASDRPGGVMVLNEQQYGYDPEPWLDYVDQHDVKGIVLVANEGAQLYRRWDPYTSLNISVLQVSFETGETIYTALNPATGQGYASVELYTNKIDPEDKTTLIRLYNDFKLSGVGRTSFFSTGWYKLTDLDMGDMASLQEDADPCTEAFPGVDCDEFGRISHLQIRALSGNNDGIPDLVGDLRNLTTLHLFDCDFSSGRGQSIPSNLGGLTNLKLFRVEAANMVGTVPFELGLIEGLSELRLPRNELSGPLPDVLVTPVNSMRQLDLSENALTGTIPARFLESPQLVELRLNGNRLSGQIPSLQFSTQLELINLRDNQLEGSIPSGPYPSTLYELDLSMNLLEGWAGGAGFNPSAWTELINLETLLLSHNNLTWDSFPMGIRTLESLRTLDLGHNQLRMNFPEVYEALGAAIPGLTTLVLAHNEMFGDIAQSSKGLLPHFTTLTTLSLAGNMLGLTYSQACIMRGWQAPAECEADTNPYNVRETCSNTNVLSRKNNDCIFHNSLPEVLPPLVRSVDLSGNYFGDALPRLLGTYVNLESVDVRDNAGPDDMPGDAAFSALQWRATNRNLPGYVTAGAQRLKYNDMGGEYHCPLLTLFSEPSRPLWVDPSYYEWAFCACEYGFYVDPDETPQQPHCTPFPVLINVTDLQGQFTDGTSGGRVRRGMDTKWHITNSTSARVLAIDMQFLDMMLTNDSIISVYAGESRLDPRVDVLPPFSTNTNVTVLHSDALVWFESPDDTGPHFRVKYTTYLDPECPPERFQTDLGAYRNPNTGEVRNLCWPSCAPGSFAQVASDGDYARYECLQCNANSYQPDQAFIKECVQCPEGSTTGSAIGQKTLTDCECIPGQAGNFEFTPGIAACTVCTAAVGVGFDCPGGTTVKVGADYYKAANSYLEYKCPLDSTCLAQPDDVPLLDYLDDSAAMCAEGSSGVLCAVCGKDVYGGKFYARNQVECTECPSSAISYISLLCVIFALVLGVVGMFHVDPAQQTAIFKIITSFLQVLYMYLAYVEVDWPTSFTNFFRWTGIANLMILELAPLDCITGSRISYYSKITFHTLIMPITALIFLTVYLTGMFLLRWFLAAKDHGLSGIRDKMIADMQEVREEVFEVGGEGLATFASAAQEAASLVTQGATAATGLASSASELTSSSMNKFTRSFSKSHSSKAEGPGPVTEAVEGSESVGAAVAAAPKVSKWGSVKSSIHENRSTFPGTGAPSVWNKSLLKYAQLRVKFKRRCINNLLWIMCMLYPGVSSVLVGYFKCVTIGDSRYLVADYDISCDSDEYVQFAGIASLCIVLFVVLTPLSIVGFLTLNRLSQRMQKWEMDKVPDPMDALAEFRRPRMPKLGRFTKWVMRNVSGVALESITGPYTTKCYYWEVNEMMRKVGIVAITVFFGESRPGLQLLVLGLYQTVCLLQHLLMLPFQIKYDQYAQTIVLGTELITMQLALGISSNAFADTGFLSIILIFINTLSLVALLTAGYFVLKANNALAGLFKAYTLFRRLIGKPVKQTKREKEAHLAKLEKLFAGKWAGTKAKGSVEVNSFSMALNPKALMDKETGTVKVFKTDYTTMYQGQVPKSPVNVADNTAVQPGSPLAITAGGEPPSSPNMAGAIVPVYSPTGGPKALAEISETQLQTLMNALRQEREPQDILEKLAELTSNKTDEDIRRRVVEAGAIPLLVGWLTPSWLTNLVSSERQLLTFRWALQTITHITRTRDYRDTVREAGLLPKLVSLLQMRKLPSPLQQAILQCTINVTAGNKPNQVMLQEEGVPLLLARMMDVISQEKDNDESATNFRFLVLALNAVLTADMPYEEKSEVVNAGGLQALIVALGPGHMDAHVDAVQSINKLCSSNIGLCTSLRELNGLTPLIFLLDWESTTPAVIKSVIICLMNCSRRDVQMREGICAIGGVAPIIGLMDREQERIVVEKATWTLNNLATGNASNQASVRAAGGVQATLSVLEWARDAPTMKAALATLIHLAEDPATAELVDQVNGLLTLVKHARGEIPNSHKDIALLALNKLASSNAYSAEKIQELVGPSLWEAVQVAVLPGTATTRQ